MLKFLKRWLGWDSDSGPFDFGDVRIRTGRGPSISAPPRAPAARPDTQARNHSPSQPAAQAKSTTPKKPRKERAPMDVLNDPRLTLDKPSDDGFDPYNTGAFNRSTSWERIGRHKR